MTQEWALADWRRDRAKDDPKPFTWRNGMVWMSVNLNEGWYTVNERGVFPEAAPMWDVSKWVSEKIKRRLYENRSNSAPAQ